MASNHTEACAAMRPGCTDEGACDCGYLDDVMREGYQRDYNTPPPAERCPVCGLPSIMKVPAGTWVYCHCPQPKSAEPAAAEVREIPLTRGLVAKVDAEDFEWLSKWKWHVTAKRGNVNAYAQRAATLEERKAGAGKSIRMHRLLCPCTDKQMVDHINGDSLDNRKANLRACNHRQNVWNTRKSNLAASKFKGVKLDKVSQKWTAQIRGQDGANLHIGSYESATEAALAYDKFAIYFRGEFAYLNFPDAVGCEIAKAVCAERDALQHKHDGQYAHDTKALHEAHREIAALKTSVESRTLDLQDCMKECGNVRRELEEAKRAITTIGDMRDSALEERDEARADWESAEKANARLREECERLRASLNAVSSARDFQRDECVRLKAENERLRAACKRNPSSGSCIEALAALKGSGASGRADT